MKHVKLPVVVTQIGDSGRATLFDCDSMVIVGAGLERSREIATAINEYDTLTAERDELRAQRDALVGACESVLAALDRIDGGGGFDLHDSDRCRDELRETLALARARGEVGQ